MTRKEAINRLQDAKDGYKEYLTDEAIDMAIQALLQEPTVQDKQAESEKYQKAFDDGYENGYAQARFDYEQKPCDKCAMKNSNSNYCKNCTVSEYHGKIASVPTKFVEQQPPVMQKSGKWLITHLSNMAYCSECDYLFKDIPASIVEHFKYCPNCSKRIVEPQESEE